MEAKQFVLETKGHCLICLHKIPPPDQAPVVSEDGEEKMKGDGDEEESVSKLCSIQRVSRYLKLDRKKIFKDLVTASPPLTADLLLPILERSELKGLLCGGCSQLTGRISDVALKLELLQMTLDSLFGELHHKMDNQEAVEEFRREMWGSSDPHTLLHYGIVDELRKETMNKSFSLIQQNAQPRVGLKRFEIIHVDPSVPVPGLSVEEEPPLEMEDSPIAVITSVQGSYRKDESDPSASTAASTTSLKITMHQSQRSVPNPSAAGSSSAPGTQEDRPAPPLPKMSLDCKICKKSYQNMRDRRDHQRTVHEGYKFQCGLCPATFTFRTGRFRHQKRVHGVEGTKRPRQENQSAGRKRRVGKKRRPKSSLSSASKKMVNSGRGSIISRKESKSGTSPKPSCVTGPPPRRRVKKFECRICHKKFPRNLAMLDHVKVRHQGMRFYCGFCKKSFGNRVTIRRHLKLVHKQAAHHMKELEPTYGSLETGNATSEHDDDADVPPAIPTTPNQVVLPPSSSSSPFPNSVQPAPPATAMMGPPPPQPTRASLVDAKPSFTIHHRPTFGSGPSTSSRDVVVLPPSNLTTTTTPPRSDLTAPNPRISNGWLNRDVEIIEIDDDGDEDMDTATANLTLEPESEPPKPQPPPEEDSDLYTVYQCQYCYKTFQSIERLRCHEAILHNNDTSSDPRRLRPEGKYECDICGKKFIYDVLARHRRQAHKQDEVQVPSSSASGSTAIPPTSSSAPVPDQATPPSVSVQPQLTHSSTHQVVSFQERDDDDDDDKIIQIDEDETRRHQCPFCPCRFTLIGTLEFHMKSTCPSLYR